jgi:hypothetical protein
VQDRRPLLSARRRFGEGQVGIGEIAMIHLSCIGVQIGLLTVESTHIERRAH